MYDRSALALASTGRDTGAIGVPVLVVAGLGCVDSSLVTGESAANCITHMPLARIPDSAVVRTYDDDSDGVGDAGVDGCGVSASNTACEASCSEKP